MANCLIVILFTVVLTLINVRSTIGNETTDQCGIRPARFVNFPSINRIVGGQRSLPGSWPWTVTILNKEIGVQRMCGATLIHPNWILTAGHCIIKIFNQSLWYAELNTYETDKMEPYSTTKDIVKIIIHPRFVNDERNGIYNDIALLKLNSSVQLDHVNHTINTACLPDLKMMNHLEIKKCYTIGWGREGKDSDTPNYLKEVRLPLVDPAKCFKNHKFLLDSNTQICAGGFPHGGQGTCFGDSGGPLHCFAQNRWHLIGVTSYGKACALPEIADVFTKVASYRDWIRQTINDNE